MQAKSNASPIQSNLGSGRHSLLALIVKPAVLTPLTGITFMNPVNLGPQALIPADTTQFHTDTITFKEWVNTNDALKNQFVTAIDDLYLKSLSYKYTCFIKQTILTMISHLYPQNFSLRPDDQQPGN